MVKQNNITSLIVNTAAAKGLSKPSFIFVFYEKEMVRIFFVWLGGEQSNGLFACFNRPQASPSQ